jgi:GT2 family glycosyltransferase
VKISVIVVAHNEGDQLPATVEAVLATGPEDMEVIVVDDQSDDGSPDAITAGERVMLVRTESRAGVTGARNLGAKYASGDILVFSDGHVRPHPGWAEPLMNELSDSTVGAVAPAISPLGDVGTPGYGFTWRSPSLATAWICEPATTPLPVPMLCGCFFVVRKDVFDRLGGFDSGLTLWGMEDAELSLCVWRLGLECRVVPASHVRHLFREKIPYTVGWPTALHNTLRVATVHFGQAAMARVLAHFSNQPMFAEAAEKVLVSDAFTRRTRLDQMSVRDGRWFIDHFQIDALR